MSHTARIKRQLHVVSSGEIPKVRIITIEDLVAVFQDIYEEPAGRVDVSRAQQMLNALGYKSCGQRVQAVLLQYESWMAKLHQRNVLFWVHGPGCWQQMHRLTAVDWMQALGEGVSSLPGHYELCLPHQLHRFSLLRRSDQVLVLEPYQS